VRGVAALLIYGFRETGAVSEIYAGRYIALKMTRGFRVWRWRLRADAEGVENK